MSIRIFVRKRVVVCQLGTVIILSNSLSVIIFFLPVFLINLTSVDLWHSKFSVSFALTVA
jgi:hypothetical protein